MNPWAPLDSLDPLDLTTCRKKRPTKSKVLSCGLCFIDLEPNDSPGHESPCDHVFCPSCLIQYTSNQISSRRHFNKPYPFPCPGSVKDGPCLSALKLGRIASLLPLAEARVLSEIEARAALGSDLVQCPHIKLHAYREALPYLSWGSMATCRALLRHPMPPLQENDLCELPGP